MWVGYKKKPCRSRAFSELRSGLGFRLRFRFGFRLRFRFGFRFRFRFRLRHHRADHFHRDAAVRGQAFDQLLALHLVLAELGYRDRLFRTFAFPEDQFLVDAFADDVVFDAESTFFRQFLVVFLAADAVGVAGDDNRADGRQRLDFLGQERVEFFLDCRASSRPC